MQFGGMQLSGTIQGVHVQLCWFAIMWYAIRGMQFIHLITVRICIRIRIHIRIRIRIHVRICIHRRI